MKKYQLFSVLSALFLLNSCQRQCCDDIVCETYVHRYGMPLDPQDWSSRGQDGQVISTRKDGVVVCTSYEAGVLNGETTLTFPHRDTIAKRYTYLNGVLMQETDYYSNGMPQKQMIHEGTTQHQLGWYENGAPQFKEIYLEGSLVSGEYLNEAQQTASSVTDYNGVRTLYDDYGQLLYVDEIQNGQMTTRRTFHPNGTPASVTPFVNGIIEGKRFTYCMGGEPATVEEWSTNCQHGNTEVFENGEKIADQPYEFGQIHGVERRYREGNCLVQENRWIQGEKHGACQNYFNEMKQTQWFFKGRPVNRSTYEALCSQ